MIHRSVFVESKRHLNRINFPHDNNTCMWKIESVEIFFLDFLFGIFQSLSKFESLKVLNPNFSIIRIPNTDVAFYFV